MLFLLQKILNFSVLIADVGALFVPLRTVQTRIPKVKVVLMFEQFLPWKLGFSPTWTSLPPTASWSSLHVAAHNPASIHSLQTAVEELDNFILKVRHLQSKTVFSACNNEHFYLPATESAAQRQLAVGCQSISPLEHHHL